MIFPLLLVRVCRQILQDQTNILPFIKTFISGKAFIMMLDPVFTVTATKLISTSSTYPYFIVSSWHFPVNKIPVFPFPTFIFILFIWDMNSWIPSFPLVYHSLLSLVTWWSNCSCFAGGAPVRWLLCLCDWSYYCFRDFLTVQHNKTFQAELLYLSSVLSISSRSLIPFPSVWCWELRSGGYVCVSRPFQWKEFIKLHTQRGPSKKQNLFIKIEHLFLLV